MPLQVVQAVACKLSLKYHTPVIEIINNQGEFINRPSKFFQWKILDGHFDIKNWWKNTTHCKGVGNRIATKNLNNSSKRRE
jgi:hypothetical protein